MNTKYYHKITSDQFYKLGGFSNSALFRNDNGHYIIKDHVNYKQVLKALSK